MHKLKKYSIIRHFFGIILFFHNTIPYQKYERNDFMANLLKERTYQLIYDYLKDIEFAYDVLKEVNGKTMNELSVKQYDYLLNCESWNRKIDNARNTSTEEYRFFKEVGYLVCNCLENLGVCTMFLWYDSIYIELVGPADDMDRAKLKCNLLNINNYIEEMREILLSIGFRL